MPTLSFTHVPGAGCLEFTAYVILHPMNTIICPGLSCLSPPGCGQRQTADPVGFGLTIPSTGRKSIGLKHPLDVIRGLDYVFTRYALDFMLGAVLAGRKPQQPSWRAPAGPQRSPTAILRLSIKFTQSIWKLFGGGGRGIEPRGDIWESKRKWPWPLPPSPHLQLPPDGCTHYRQ